jgi:hypothetical protein
VFLKAKDIVLTNEYWRIAVNLDVTAYQDVIATLREHLLLLINQRREFTAITELKQIETLLQTLELKLYNFQQILPKLENRRGLINFGGTILKSLFGTATTADLLSLHRTLDDLQEKHADVTHTLSNQLTYIKKLGTLTLYEICLRLLKTQ